MIGFVGILDTGQVEGHKMMKDKLIDGIARVQRQNSQNAGSKFDDYLISPKIR